MTPEAIDKAVEVVTLITTCVILAFAFPVGVFGIIMLMDVLHDSYEQQKEDKYDDET